MTRHPRDGQVFTSLPFGNQATFGRYWGRPKARGFAPPPRDGFALSRMKGVRAAQRAGTRPGRTTKTGPAVCFSTLVYNYAIRKLAAASLVPITLRLSDRPLSYHAP